MTDLITFLNARLDEDEAAARAALPIYGPGWRPENSKVARLGPARIGVRTASAPLPKPHGAYLRRTSPATTRPAYSARSRRTARCRPSSVRSKNSASVSGLTPRS